MLFSSECGKIFTENLKPNFKGNEKEYKEGNNRITSIALGFLTLSGILSLGYFSIHNIRKSDELINKGIKNTKKAIKNLIKDFNEGKPIEPIKGSNGETLIGIDAYKHIIKNLVESIHIWPVEVEGLLNEKLPTGTGSYDHLMVDYSNAENMSRFMAAYTAASQDVTFTAKDVLPTPVKENNKLCPRSNGAGSHNKNAESAVAWLGKVGQNEKEKVVVSCFGNASCCDYHGDSRRCGGRDLHRRLEYGPRPAQCHRGL